jgi:hypothetical protein
VGSAAVVALAGTLFFSLLASQAGLGAELLRAAGDRRPHAVRAHLLEMAGDRAVARASYLAAAARTTNLPQQRYLQARPPAWETTPVAGACPNRVSAADDSDEGCRSSAPSKGDNAMSLRTASIGAPAFQTSSTSSTSQTTLTPRLLACGIIAGPLFLAVWLIQALTRDGFDLRRHPLSLLSLGDLGWIQIANFVVAGALCVACARGMWPALRPGRGGAWGPLLGGGLGVGLIVAGIFVADAGAGFPPGAPAGAPERMSWHGILHEVGFTVASLSWLAACGVFARRFAALKQRGWVRACIATALAALTVAAWPDLDSLSVRLVIASAIQFAFVAALAAHLIRELPNAAVAAAA